MKIGLDRGEYLHRCYNIWHWQLDLYARLAIEWNLFPRVKVATLPLVREAFKLAQILFFPKHRLNPLLSYHAIRW